MQVHSVSNQSFSGLQYHPNYKHIEYILATKTGWSGFDKATKMMNELSKNKVHSDIYIAGDLVKAPKIYVQVEGKLFKENFLFGPVTTIKKALKYANKLI